LELEISTDCGGRSQGLAGLAASNSEAVRKIRKGAVRIDGQNPAASAMTTQKPSPGAPGLGFALDL